MPPSPQAPLAAPKPITLLTKEPIQGSVMLLEGYGSARLTFRMFCAVESAARNHPDLPVFLLMTSPVSSTCLAVGAYKYEVYDGVKPAMRANIQEFRINNSPY